MDVITGLRRFPGSYQSAENAIKEIDRLRAELAATKEALKPFADLHVTRFMTDGLRYDFRVDAAWIRKARTVGGKEE